MKRQPFIAPYLFQTADGAPVPAQRGRLWVLENRQEPASNTIELSFLRILSTARQTGPPVVFLPGGPGVSIDEYAVWLWSLLLAPLQSVCDVIFLEQRGIGQSLPRLDCLPDYHLPLDEPLDFEREVAATGEYAARWLSFWQEQGVDPAGYNAHQMASDVDDLRRALGYDQISLAGGSFGSHHALSVLRYHGAQVHRAAIWGIEGPDHTVKLPGQVQQCLEDLHRLALEQIDWLDGDGLLGLVAAVLEQLDRAPVVATARHPRSGDPVKITLGKNDLQRATAANLGSTPFLRSLPARYQAMRAADFSWLAQEAIEYRLSPPDRNLMPILVDYASGATAARRALIDAQTSQTLLGNGINEPFHRSHHLLGRFDLGDEFRGPLRCDVPSLLISRDLDARTPPGNAIELLPGLPNGRHMIMSGASHDFGSWAPPSPQLKHVLDRVWRFLAGQEIDTTTVDLPFVFEHTPSRRHIRART
ncbi:MAG: alpha/beta hydrolase [Caldilineales bacterium]